MTDLPFLDCIKHGACQISDPLFCGFSSREREIRGHSPWHLPRIGVTPSRRPVSSHAAAKSGIIAPVRTSSNEIYEAVLALSRSIAGRTDLDALVLGVAASLRRIVRFDHVGLVLHDPIGNVMQGYILNEPGNPVITRLRLAVDEDPGGLGVAESADAGGLTGAV